MGAHPAPLTVREFFEEAYRPFRLAGKADTTVDAYRAALNHLTNGGPDPALVDCDAAAIAGCCARLIDAGRSPATADKTRRHLAAILNYAATLGKIDAAPKTDRIDQPKKIPEAWTVEQVAAILDAAKKQPGKIAGIPAPLWWSGLLLVLYDTGLRIGAALALRWEDYRTAPRPHVIARHETQKQKADQLLDLADETVAALNSLAQHLAFANVADIPPAARDCVFPWPHDQGRPNWPTLTRRFRKILAAAGLPAGRRDLFHRLRRTTASYLAAAGANAQHRLGHSSATVTAAYLDPRITGLVDGAAKLPRPGKKRGEARR